MVKPVIPYTSFTNNVQAMYPAYLKVSAFGQERVVNLTDNLDGTIEFDKVSVFELHYAGVTWSVYADEACTTLHDGWNINGKNTSVVWDGQGLRSYYNGTPFLLDLSSITAETLTVPMSVILDELDEDDFFPIYMNVVLSDQDGNFTPVAIQQKIESAETVPSELVFTAVTGEAFSNNDYLYIQVGFYTDEEYTVTDDVHWSNGYLQADLWADGKLHDGLSEFKLVFRPVKVDVAPSLYKVAASTDTPLYVRASIDRNNWTVVERTDSDRFTLTLDHLGLVGKNNYYIN